MPISPTLPTDGQSDWDVPLNAALTEIVDEVNAQETDIAGKANTSHTHDIDDINATGTPSSSTYLRGDGTWSTPAGGGGGAVDSVNGQTGTVSLDQDDIGDGTTYKQYSGTEKTKLSGIATGATANSSDATLLDRANHTGTQAQSTVTNLVTDLAGKASSMHNHAASDINSGTVATARLGSGTANSGTYLRGDQTYAALPTSSDTVQGIVELATTAEATTGTDTARAVTAAGVAAVVAATRARYSAVNAQTGTTYAPVLGDESQLVTLSNAASITVTMPSDATTAFPTGATIDFVVIGAGMATFSAGSGATVNPTSVTRAQWSAVTAIKRASNTWLIVGDLA